MSDNTNYTIRTGCGSNDCNACGNTRNGCGGCNDCGNTHTGCGGCNDCDSARNSCNNCGCNACGNARNGCSGCNNCGNWNEWNNWNGWNWIDWNSWNWFNCWNRWHWHNTQSLDGSACSRFMQPILSSPAQFSNAGTENGATLVIHKIVLEPCGNTTCTPRTFNIRVTGPSYPCGEIFRMRAGSCLELDEPLVLTGLRPGTYCIEEIFTCPNEYITTFTGPVCGRHVTVSNSFFPTVVTICNRKRLCRLCHGFGCGCTACSACR